MQGFHRMIFNALFNLIWLSSSCTVLGNPVEIALETLENLIHNTDPPKGEPFPQIPGPKKDDKVSM